MAAQGDKPPLQDVPPLDPRIIEAIYGRQDEDEIDLLEYWWLIWKSKRFILAFTLGIAVTTAGYALILPNQYQAEVLLAPVSSEGSKTSGLASALGGLGGIASLAGISLPGGGNTEEDLAVLRSRDFLWRFIREQKLMPILFAKDWDAEKKQWRESASEDPPGRWDAYRKLTKGGVLRVSTDKKTHLVTVAVEWIDPEIAAQWANTLVSRLNDYLRQRAIADSASNLKYLNLELARTQVEDIRKALYELISQEQKKLMLANTRVQYAFRVLDMAEAPDKKTKPKRSLMVLLSTVVAAFLAIVVVLIRSGVKKSA